MIPVALVLSTHLDDAVISMGVATQRLALSYNVMVATVFTEHGDGPLSLPARIFNTSAQCGAPEYMAERRKEDKRALSLLAATPVHLGFVDATFRRDKLGHPRCARPQDILTTEPADEGEVIDEVTASILEFIAELRPHLLLVPCGAGRHLDHRIVRIAADRVFKALDPRELPRSHGYYEDLPYAYVHGIATGSVPLGYEPHVIAASAEEWNRKLTAIRLYSSQLGFLDIGRVPWVTVLEIYGREVGLGDIAERLWMRHEGAPVLQGTDAAEIMRRLNDAAGRKIL